MGALKEFRTLIPEDIELRVGTATENGFSILLYKNARLDMQLLDETLGSMNWQRSHEVVDGRLCCTVSIWDEEKQQWIKKQDVGTESMTEKDKGQFSDAFKRACFNLGIGRELYTAPFIWISGHTTDRGNNGRYKADQKFVSGLKVSKIEYDDKRRISNLIIVDKNGEEVYTMGKPSKGASKKKKDELTAPRSISARQAQEIKGLLEQTNSDVKQFLAYYKASSVDDMKEDVYDDAKRKLALKLKKMQEGA